MIAAFNRLADSLPRWAMDRFEASGVLPQVLMDALDADWRQDVSDWKLATGLDYGPLTRRERLALQAWRQDRAPRPQAGPPRDFPTSRYEEPWLARVGNQVAAENDWDGADSFKNDFAAAEFLRRQLQRVGPVKRLKLKNGNAKPAVTAYAGSEPRHIPTTPELVRQLLARLARARRALPPPEIDEGDSDTGWSVASARAQLNASHKRRGLNLRKRDKKRDENDNGTRIGGARWAPFSYRPPLIDITGVGSGGLDLPRPQRQVCLSADWLYSPSLRCKRLSQQRAGHIRDQR
jgi:hypothetical protein